MSEEPAGRGVRSEQAQKLQLQVAAPTGARGSRRAAALMPRHTLPAFVSFESLITHELIAWIDVT